MDCSCDNLSKKFLMCLPETSPFEIYFLGGWAKKEGNSVADQSLDARRIAKEQEDRMAASASIGFNAAKPFVQFQTSMMRLFAENIDQAARNYEKSFQAISNIISQSRREAA
jgi:hypothetical protein